MRAPDNAVAQHRVSIEIAADPDTLYDMVSDITRMGEWSPESTGGRWLDDGTGVVGDWFVGSNATPERNWERECQVAQADRGSDFTFVVGGVEKNCTWWSYEFEPIDAGTRVTEHWWFVNKTPAMAAASDEAVQQRIAYTEEMLHHTLGALKQAAEQT